MCKYFKNFVRDSNHSQEEEKPTKKEAQKTAASNAGVMMGVNVVNRGFSF